MSRGLIADNLERGFRAYAASGGNIGDACAILRAEGLDVRHRQLVDWAARGGWVRRLAEADALLVAEQRDPRGRMIASLLIELGRYEALMRAGGPPEPQVTYAYGGLVGLLDKLLPAVAPAGAAAGEFRRRALEILRDDYGLAMSADEDAEIERGMR